MPIQLQGNWTVQLVSQPIDQPQRFIISGAIIGNGIYSDTYTTPIGVTGINWSIDVQEEGSWSNQPGKWISSTNIRRTDIVIENGYEVFYLEADDYRGGVNYDDLVLRLSRPLPPPPPPDPVPNEPIPPSDPLPIPDVPVNPPVPPKPMSYGRVFTKIDSGDKLPRQTFVQYYGMWVDYTGSNLGNLTQMYTCSNDTGSFKKTVYNAPCTSCGSTPMFDIAYGHDGGSGSRDLGGNDFYTPTNAVYGQYRQLCLDEGVQRFSLGNKEVYHFYALNIKKERMDDAWDEGNIEINIGELSGSKFLQGNPNRNAHTGSNVKLSGTGKVLRLIDDSNLNLGSLTQYSYMTSYLDISSSLIHNVTSAGKVFHLVSGTLETGVYNPTQPHVYGLLYPQQGIAILDADLLDLSASFLTVTGSDVNGDNSMKLFTAISGAALYTDASGDILGFQSRKLRYNYQEQYFIRVKNQEYNFTNNLTWVTGSEQDIKDDFKDKPQVYITTVGLYNEQKELLAVAKLSKPIYKSFTEETLVEVNLTW